MSNKYNNNKHDAANPEHNETQNASMHGELRNGRLSMIKNSNPADGARGIPENEYLDEKSNSRGEQ